jgi:isopentenyl diphosphate isomerase/L-lactate dehydrogenase-like FMN-dependent dehydrogenase
MHQLVQAGHAKMKPIAWNYLLGCSDTETTMRRNCQALDSIAFKPRAAQRRQGRYARQVPRQDDASAIQSVIASEAKQSSS